MTLTAYTSLATLRRSHYLNVYVILSVVVVILSTLRALTQAIWRHLKPLKSIESKHSMCFYAMDTTLLLQEPSFFEVVEKKHGYLKKSRFLI